MVYPLWLTQSARCVLTRRAPKSASFSTTIVSAASDESDNIDVEGEAAQMFVEDFDSLGAEVEMGAESDDDAQASQMSSVGSFSQQG